MPFPPYVEPVAPVAPLPTTTIGRHRRLVPTALALLLALISLPLVMVVLPTVDTTGGFPQSNTPMANPLSPGVISASLTSVLFAALIAGAAWGPTALRHPWRGGIGAFLTAFVVGTAVLPLAPAVLGQRLVVGKWCIDGCMPVIHSFDELSGVVMATIGLPLSLVFAPGIDLVLAAGVVIWGRVLRRMLAQEESVRS